MILTAFKWQLSEAVPLFHKDTVPERGATALCTPS